MTSVASDSARQTGPMCSTGTWRRQLGQQCPAAVKHQPHPGLFIALRFQTQDDVFCWV